MIRYMAHTAASFFGKFLVDLLCLVELTCFDHLCDYRAFVLRLGLFDDFLCCPLLYDAEIENGRTILITNIWALAVQLRWIMHPKKLFQECFVVDLAWVELDQHCLSMTSVFITNLFVPRVLGGATGVAYRGLSHTWHLIKIILNTPETSGRKECLSLPIMFLGNHS